MAESQRKSDAAKVVDDDAQTARDRRNLIIMLVGGVLVVFGMIALSKFLSGS